MYNEGVIQDRFVSNRLDKASMVRATDWQISKRRVQESLTKVSSSYIYLQGIRKKNPETYDAKYLFILQQDQYPGEIRVGESLRIGMLSSPSTSGKTYEDPGQ